MTTVQMSLAGVSTEGMTFHPNSLRLTPLAPFLRPGDAAGIPRRSMRRVLEAGLLACVEQAGFGGTASVRLVSTLELVGPGRTPVSMYWGKAPETWPAEWNPVLCLSDDAVTAPHRVLELARLTLCYPHDWRGLDRAQRTIELRRGDGAYVTMRLTPELLAKAGPRRLGDTRAVMRELFGALGEALVGAPMMLDASGVAWIQIGTVGPEGLPLLTDERRPGWVASSWYAWWWPLFDSLSLKANR